MLNILEQPQNPVHRSFINSFILTNMNEINDNDNNYNLCATHVLIASEKNQGNCFIIFYFVPRFFICHYLTTLSGD